MHPDNRNPWWMQLGLILFGLLFVVAPWIMGVVYLVRLL